MDNDYIHCINELHQNDEMKSKYSLIEIELTTSVVIGTDCIDSCKSNYHTITATTVPSYISRIPYISNEVQK